MVLTWLELLTGILIVLTALAPGPGVPAPRRGSILRLDCWQFDVGTPLGVAHRSQTLKLFYGSKLHHDVFSLTPIAIPPNSVPPTGFREVIAGYRREMGTETRLTVDSITRRGPVEVLEFHEDVQDRHNKARRIITDVFRYRWHLLEVIRVFTTNRSYIQAEKSVLDSIKLAKRAPAAPLIKSPRGPIRLSAPNNDLPHLITTAKMVTTHLTKLEPGGTLVIKHPDWRG